jgi:uncharacterized membrane protein YbaN (DUF454 family)
VASFLSKEDAEGTLSMKRLIRIALGAICILLGIPGLVLPILPGWLFLALGFLLLSVDLPFFERLVLWVEKRVPRLKEPVERLRQYLGNSKGQKKR